MANGKAYGKFPVTTYKADEGFTEGFDSVVNESSIRIFFNGDEIVSILALKQELQELALGFLYDSCIINDIALVEKIDVNDRLDAVMVESSEKLDSGMLTTVRSVTSGCGKGVAFINPLKEKHFGDIENAFVMKPRDVTQLMADFGRASGLFKETGGVHSAAWSDGKKLVRVSEDIGRHNCIDKLVGWKLMQKEDNIGTEIIFTSGRISSEIVTKAIRARVPILISHSAPTSGAIQLADEFGLTLVGFVRGQRFNIYTHPERITENDD
jgi:FdhD protein